jgi:hypothetical protein
VGRHDAVLDRLNPALLGWVRVSARTTRPAVLEILPSHADTTDVVILRSRRAMRAYLETLPAGSMPSAASETGGAA